MKKINHWFQNLCLMLSVSLVFLMFFWWGNLTPAEKEDRKAEIVMVEWKRALPNQATDIEIISDGWCKFTLDNERFLMHNHNSGFTKINLEPQTYHFTDE